MLHVPRGDIMKNGIFLIISRVNGLPPDEIRDVTHAHITGYARLLEHVMASLLLSDPGETLGLLACCFYALFAAPSAFNCVVSVLRIPMPLIH